MNKSNEGIDVKTLMILLALVVLCSVPGSALAQDTNPLFKEAKIKNYLPHMTWAEVEQALQRTDMAIIPVGSIEQHGKHLPLGTDTYATVEMCKLIAQRTDVVIAPVVLAGLSEHHMAFPGTITLSPATFEAVVYETAESLIRHGFKKIMIANGHGGNDVSVRNVLQKLNQNTPATAVLLNDLSGAEIAREGPKIDSHAGESETSGMLYLANPLVDMSRAEKPVLTLPDVVTKAQAGEEAEPNLKLIESATMFRPKSSGKGSSTREMTNIGVFSTGDPRKATAQRGREDTEAFVQAAVKFIEAWKKISR